MKRAPDFALDGKRILYQIDRRGMQDYFGPPSDKFRNTAAGRSTSGSGENNKDEPMSDFDDVDAGPGRTK